MTGFVAIPPRGPARFVIPRSPGAATTGLRFFGAAESGRSAKVAVRLVAAGVGRILPASAEARRWSQAVANAASAAGLGGTFVVHVGPPRANRKPVAVVLDAGRPTAIIKVGVNELTDSLLETESRALTELAGGIAAPVVTPRLLAAGTADDHWYLVQELLNHEGGPPDLALAASGAAAIARSGPRTLAALDTGPWASGLRAAVAQLPHSADHAAVTQALQTLPPGPEVWHGRSHGDFSPWNCRSHRDRLAVWDWERFRTQVPEGFDLAHFTLFDLVRRGATFPEAAQGLVSVLDARHSPTPVDHAVIRAYLLDIAVRFTTDDQRASGTAAGRVAEWLPQALHTIQGTEGY